MPIKRITPKQQARQYLDEQLARWRKSIIDNLILVGEAAFTQAKSYHKYKSRSGNLNSSIGYCILDNGKVVVPAKFEVVNGGEQGAAEGRKFLKQLIAENSQGIVFIMVAGMPYAQYVEAMSLDVLDSAEMLAKRMIPKIMKSLKFR